MSGHSKWSTIKRKKAAEDAKRGKLFTKLGREIALAARESGPDPEVNFKLRLAIDKAKQANMPKDNIERAIERGAGTGKEGDLEEITYEGYGPSGSAMMVSVLTDNRNRSVADVRRVFDKFGGNLGANGCVSWMFDRKGYITIKADGDQAEEMALMAIDAGAEDVTIEGGMVEVYTAVDDFEAVKTALEEDDIKLESAELSWIPQNRTSLDDSVTVKNMKLIDNLEDLDDVMQVYSNLDIDEELMENYSEES
jgi:YebC/PmpR family DNA-binding regulatory protein